MCSLQPPRPRSNTVDKEVPSTLFAITEYSYSRESSSDHDYHYGLLIEHFPSSSPTGMAQIQKGLKNILQKHPNDVVFFSALRTPITRSYKGGLRNAYPEQMLAAVGLNLSYFPGASNSQITRSSLPRSTKTPIFHPPLSKMSQSGPSFPNSAVPKPPVWH